ncbi:MAG: hypothetical protein WCT10_03675 [Patescibacteria group bacterium]|jgi:hypothetical protein
MVQKKSESVFAVGTTFEIIVKLSGAVRDLGGSDDHLRRILSDEKLRREIAGLLVGKSLAEMIAKCKFSYVNPVIDEQNLLLAGPVADISDMLVVSQKDLGGQDMTTAAVEAAIDCMGYRPASLVEQLVYAKAKWNGKDHVNAWVESHNQRYISSLSGDGAGDRELTLFRIVSGFCWFGDIRFLVVRK